MRAISEMDGSDLGQVKDLIFDHDANQVLALLMSERDLFGLIDAQIIPWEQVTSIGPDAITVISRDSRVKAGSDHRVHSVMHRDTALSGTRIFTTDGKNLGTLADTLIDETSGRIEGYEISGGFVADTMTGKKFLPAEYDLSVGRDVALVPPAAAENLQSQRGGAQGHLQNATQSAQVTAQSAVQEVRGAVQEAGAGVSQSIFHAYDTARDKVGAAYEEIAGASVEKQKTWVVGKTAAHDVVIPASAVESASTPLASTPVAPESGLASEEIASKEIETPGTSDMAADVTSSGEVVHGEVLVRAGEVITAEHAERAAQAGVLGPLVAAAVSGAAGEAYAAGQEKISGAVGGATHRASTPVADSASNLQEQLHARAVAATLGQPAARDVLAEDGSVIVFAGQILTPEILEDARRLNREKEVLASAGLGAISQSAQSAGAQVTEAATGLWEAARSKVSEWTHAAEERRAEADAHAERERIKQALGRPVTRVILDQNDAVILNAGEIITHAAVERSREAGILDVLLNSVHFDTPEINPEMRRAGAPGESAISRNSTAASAPVSIDADGTKTYQIDDNPEATGLESQASSAAISDPRLADGDEADVDEIDSDDVLPDTAAPDDSMLKEAMVGDTLPPRGRPLPR
jgi:uncharacterized protein YrrD